MSIQIDYRGINVLEDDILRTTSNSEAVVAVLDVVILKHEVSPPSGEA